MDFAAGVYLYETHTPYSIPPPYTPHTCTQYTYSHWEGGEGGELNQREGEGNNSSQIWVENTNMTDCISSL
jgi:hypothetical protein